MEELIKSMKEELIKKHVARAKAAKQGKILCKKHKCEHYKRRYCDGKECREIGCDRSNPLIDYDICPFAKVAPYRYDPFEIKSNLLGKGERVDFFYECFKEAFIETIPFGEEIKNAVDQVYNERS